MRHPPKARRKFTAEEIGSAKARAHHIASLARHESFSLWAELPWESPLYMGPPRCADEQPTALEAKCRRCGRTLVIRFGDELKLEGSAVFEPCRKSR